MKACQNDYLKNKKRRKVWHKANIEILQEEPCVICNCLPTHRHHPDYDKPTEVIFLCPFHHKAEHKKMKNEGCYI